ncbi:hypothetical protein JOQ06_025899, partial [Pogonophryne albipinna]
MDDTQPDSESEPNGESNLALILKELRELRKDFGQQLSGIKEDISKIGKRVEEAEERINGAENRIQSSKDVLTELVKLQMQTEAKLTDLEGRSRRENVRIHGVKEGAEEGTASVIAFVEDFLAKSLELPPSIALNIERAHRALAPKPPNEAPPRSIVFKFSSYTVKEDVLKRAWQKKGFDFQGKRIQLDHDNAPEEGTVVYGSVEEATLDMAKRGIPVTVVKKTTSLLDQISRMTWRSSEKRGNRGTTRTNQGFKERLHAYRRSVLLEKSARITRNARIITMNGVIENVSTYVRRCPQCHMIYRYQEWQDSLHNFDDHVILSLELCVYLRASLQNNVSVSKVLNSLEVVRKVTFPARDTILHGYMHFEALTTNDYSYSCVCCGYYPPVVVMDLHKRSVQLACDLKEASENYIGEVNIEEFWDSVHHEMIARGFFQSRAKNSFAANPSFEHWGPWIGKNTRKSDTVLNTEFKKVSSSKSSPEAELSMVSEDRLVDELKKQKVSNVRKLCMACNLDSKGSRDDLVNRLREEMKTRHGYDKIFQKIWGASGGWSVILCPHGVVYSLKFNLRAESPRDFTDLLLSWKHLPNASIYDFARGLATHANLRFPASLPFKPHEGRLAASTHDDITAAQNNKLKVSLPWITQMLKTPDEDGHPLTGSSNHYVLYDEVHEGNTKDPQEVLRRINVVPELQDDVSCGTHCEDITKCDKVGPCQASWKLQTHPAQEQLKEEQLQPHPADVSVGKDVEKTMEAPTSKIVQDCKKAAEWVVAHTHLCTR